MTSHRDVEHVPHNDKASSPDNVMSGRGSGDHVVPLRGVPRRPLSNLEKKHIFMAKP